MLIPTTGCSGGVGGTSIPGGCQASTGQGPDWPDLTLNMPRFEQKATWLPEVPSSSTYSLWITNVWVFQKHNVVPQISCMQNSWDLVLYYHFPYSLKPGTKGTKNGPLLLEVLTGDLGGSVSLRLKPFYRLWEQRIWTDHTGTERLTQGNIHTNHQYNGCVTCSEVNMELSIGKRTMID